jgi:hypothetical protein
MAVNHADGTLFVSIVFYPIAAAAGAAHAGAGWFSILFIPAGLALGAGIIAVGRPLVYAITGFGLSRGSKIPKGWLQQIFFAPFFLLYMILPLVIVWGSVAGIWFGSIWITRHIF